MLASTTGILAANEAPLDPASGKFLGETYAVSYAPSATVLSTLDQKPNLKNSHLLAVADPDIHHAKEEVNAIGALYPGSSKIVTKPRTGRRLREFGSTCWPSLR